MLTGKLSNGCLLAQFRENEFRSFPTSSVAGRFRHRLGKCWYRCPMKKKLLLKKNTVRNLTQPDLERAIGGRDAGAQDSEWPACPTSHSFVVAPAKR